MHAMYRNKTHAASTSSLQMYHIYNTHIIWNDVENYNIIAVKYLDKIHDQSAQEIVKKS